MCVAELVLWEGWVRVGVARCDCLYLSRWPRSPQGLIHCLEFQTRPHLSKEGNYHHLTLGCLGYEGLDVVPEVGCLP